MLQATGQVVAPIGPREEGRLARVAIGFTAWAEKWFPDAFVFVAIAVVIVALAALANGASPAAVSQAFGNGFWSLITFTMQMAFVAIGGYVVATSAPAARFIRALAATPQTGPGAVGLVATVSILASLLNWGLSLIFGGLLVRALAHRVELRMELLRRCRRRLSRARCHLGHGAIVLRGTAAGESREPPQGAAPDHGRDPVLRDHLPLAVQVYNAAEALPNLINPFWMLPLLGVLGLRARDIVGFTFLQLLVHLPLVLFLLWALAFTLPYHPPVVP